MPGKNCQSIKGHHNILIRDVVDSNVFIVMGDKVIQFPQKENLQKAGLRETMCGFIRSKLTEIGRSEEWLKAMVLRELNIVYDDLATIEESRLYEICSFINQFHISK